MINSKTYAYVCEIWIFIIIYVWKLKISTISTRNLFVFLLWFQMHITAIKSKQYYYLNLTVSPNERKIVQIVDKFNIDGQIQIAL